MTYELHPLCTLFPRVTGAEFDALVSDIKANGLQNPIVLHDGMVLDGGNRYRACLEAGIEPSFNEYKGDSIVSFVLSANLHRRHLSPGQQAAIVSSAQDWAKAQGRGNPQLRNVAQLDTAKDRAAQSGASHRTQQMADKVAKADPELAKKVAHGEVTLPKAVEQISPKPKRELIPARVDFGSEQELKEAHHTIGELAQEVEQLRDKLAVEQMDASEEAKSEAAETIAGLRKQIKHMEVELDAMRLSRDAFQAENAELKKQISMLNRKAKKAA